MLNKQTLLILSLLSILFLVFHSVAQGQQIPITSKNVTQLTQVAVIPAGPFAAFSTNGRLLATGSFDGAVKIWKPGNWQKPQTVRNPGGSVWGVAFSPDGNLLANWGENRIELWEVSTQKQVRVFTRDDGWISSVTFSSDNKVAFAGNSNGTIDFFELKGGRKLASIAAHTGTVMSLALSPDGKVLSSGGGSGDSQICLWDVNTRQKTRNFSGHAVDVHGLTFTPNGNTLVSTGQRSTVKCWSVNDGEPVRMLKGHQGNVFAVDISPNGTLLATGCDDKTVILWDIEGACKLRALPHEGEGFVAQFSPDGSILATPGAESSIILWAVQVSTSTVLR